MGMRALTDLRKLLCKELDEIAMKKEMSAGDLDAVHKLTDTIKNIDKIEMLEEQQYSNYGGSYARGYAFDDGYSRNDAVFAHEAGSYGRGDSYRGYSGRRYSMHDGKQDIIKQLEEMMTDPTLGNEDRMALKRVRQQLQQ